MSKLTLLLAWLAPLWFLQTPLAHKLGFIVHRYSSGWWHVRCGNHHFSTSPSLRTALLAALRKLGQSRPAKSQPPTP